jgi:membrane protease YdiL (CAAX protease family)
MVGVLPLWILVSFVVAQQLTAGLLWVLHNLQVPPGSLNQNVLTTILAVFIYALTIGLVVGLPWIIKKDQTTATDIGLHRLPLWRDLLMAPVGLVIYLILSLVLMLVVSAVVPSFNINQAQDTGFSGVNQQYELILAFLTLVVLAPVAEEVLFRGYLFGKLQKYVPVWVAILATSVLFGFVHVAFSQDAWNVAIDTFALSVVLCLLRISTGSIWASMLLHMIKNAIAFYVLFVNPVLNGTIGG